MIPVLDLYSPEGRARWNAIIARRENDNAEAREIAGRIIRDVREEGESAVFRYTKRFDGAEITRETAKVSRAEFEEARRLTGERLIEVMRRCKARIRAFHEKQSQKSWMEPGADGEVLGQLVRPIERAGVYVPGGKAAYPSSVIMNAVPAAVAGVSEIYIVTPPGKDGKINPAILAAAEEAGVTAVYKAGGAQAVAALAYGAGVYPKVDKIVGPGNIYVAMAKRALFGQVGIDSVAGPSEILVIADKTANPAFAAADLLSQAEHDEMASAVLITNDAEFARAAAAETAARALRLPRRDIIEKSLSGYGAVFVTETIEEAFAASNAFAPEHLEICVEDPLAALSKITNAGAVFMGHYAPEPLGDYAAGPNHVLPTGGTPRFFSALSVDDFLKKTSVLSFTKRAMETISGDVIAFAEAEGLTAHAEAVRARLQ